MSSTITNSATETPPGRRPASPRHDAIADLEHELSVTRRALASVPEAHFAWQPHEKSSTLGRLASHITDIAAYPAKVVTRDHLDLGASPASHTPPASLDALLHRFDQSTSEALAVLGAASEEALGETWTLRRGDAVLMALPRVAVIRTLVISHMVHHRAQLGVYLRLLDVPVPGTYGPSADSA